MARGDRRDRKSDDQPEQAADLRLVAGSRAVPTEFALMQNYRAHSTLLDGRIRALREASPVVQRLGEEVSTVVDARQESGYHTATISADNFASGVYFYRLTADRSGRPEDALIR